MWGHQHHPRSKFYTPKPRNCKPKAIWWKHWSTTRGNVMRCGDLGGDRHGLKSSWEQRKQKETKVLSGSLSYMNSPLPVLSFMKLST